MVRPSWFRRIRALIVTLALFVAGMFGVTATSVGAATADCGENPDGLHQCSYYDTDGNGVNHLAGDSSAAPTEAVPGDTITLTATSHLKPYFDHFGAQGNVRVNLNMSGIGKVVGYGPKSSATMSVQVGTSGVQWTAVETATSGPCPPGGDAFTPCDGTPTGTFAQNAQFFITVLVDPSPGSSGRSEWGFGAHWTSTFGEGVSYGDPVFITYGGPPKPKASFTVSTNTKAPGQYQFLSDSSDPFGSDLTSKWTFGDGKKADGATVTHTFAKPGTFHVTLTVTNSSGGTASTTKDVVVKAPTLSAALSFVDAKGVVLTTVTPQIGDTIHVRLRLSASSDGVGPVHGIGFTGAPLTVAPSGLVDVAGPTPAIPTAFALDPGGTKVFAYTLTVTGTGVVRLTSTPKGTDDSGAAAPTTAAQLSTGISGLKVELTLNPATFTEDEDAAGPKPVDVTVTEKITNVSGDEVTHLNLRSLEATRTAAGQPLSVTLKSGPVPDTTAGYPLLKDLAAGESMTLISVFTVKDDGKIQFQSLVTGANQAGLTLRGFGSTLLNAKPKYYLGLKSHVVRPGNGALLPAGSPIVISGTVKNLTDSATLDVGPLYAKVTGNAGLQGLAYNGVGVDPKALQVPGALTLKPGEEKAFTLKVLTTYSEPRGGGGVVRSGGTRADVTFTPWATVTEDDGTKFVTAEDGSQTLATADDLTHRIAIDDGIPIPASDWVVVAQGMVRGGIEGVWNAASGMVTGLIDLPNISASTLLAVTNYQSIVWDSFTDAQKEAFGRSIASAGVPALQANIKLAAQGAPALFDQANKFALKYFTDLDNEWHVGNYAETVQTYSALTSNALAQVIIPVALGKLAQSSEAARAAQLAQVELQARLAAIGERIDSAETMQQVARLLTEISAGSELDPTRVRNLFGISPAELEELQKLATEYRVLLTVRSRAASSIDWIEKFQAMVKPEAIKIKSVSALDTRLGYAEKYVGSLVFKEPVPLIELRKNGGQISDLVQAYVEQQGFTPGTGEYYDAINRVSDRISEWNKYAKTYKKWSKQGWLDVSFNWDGNKMRDPTFGGTGKEAGFRLKPTGVDEEYVVQMYNERARKLVPVTGDIDPIAFTHLDGSPLTDAEHAALVDRMRTNPLLRSQHGESATYVDGGKDFIESQFKAREAGLQIAPNAVAPRVVRFNKAQSIWKSASDYHLIWDGGFDYAGASPVTQGSLHIDYSALAAPETPAPAGIALALPGSGGVNVGRCAMTYSTSPSALPLEMSPAGTLVQIVGTGFVASTYESVCFTEGPAVAVSIRPSTTVSTGVAAGEHEVPVAAGKGMAAVDPSTGFAVGQQVAIDAGGPAAESGEIAGFGSIILRAPLRHAHRAGEVIVMTRPPRRADRTDGASHTAAVAATGVPVDALLTVADMLLLLGVALTAGGTAGRRRRRA